MQVSAPSRKTTHFGGGSVASAARRGDILYANGILSVGGGGGGGGDGQSHPELKKMGALPLPVVSPSPSEGSSSDVVGRSEPLISESRSLLRHHCCSGSAAAMARLGGS